MRILLDTQVLVWLISDDARLSKKMRGVLADPANDLFVSYFSLLELTIKASIGKLTYHSSLIDDLPHMGIELLMPEADVLRTYKLYNPENRDPFDNLLLATAESYKLTLITSDHKILATNVDVQIQAAA